MIVANDVTQEGAGFDTDTNIVTLFLRDGRDIALPKMTKLEVANRILDQALQIQNARSSSLSRGKILPPRLDRSKFPLVSC